MTVRNDPSRDPADGCSTVTPKAADDGAPTSSPTPARVAAETRAAASRPAPHALARWSERRRRVAETEGRAPDPSPPAEDDRAAALAANREAAEAIDVDALRPGADVSAFLREGVPDALRRRALRTMWRSDPVFANVDRLCDYDDDFRDPKMVLETLQSAWQAGRGYLFPEDDAEADTEDDAEADTAGGEVGRAGQDAPGGAVAGSSVRPPEPMGGRRSTTSDEAASDEAATADGAMPPPTGRTQAGSTEAVRVGGRTDGGSGESDAAMPPPASSSPPSAGLPEPTATRADAPRETAPATPKRSPTPHALRARLGL